LSRGFVCSLLHTGRYYLRAYVTRISSVVAVAIILLRSHASSNEGFAGG